MYVLYVLCGVERYLMEKRIPLKLRRHPNGPIAASKLPPDTPDAYCAATAPITRSDVA
jgi:hypothetical protein